MVGASSLSLDADHNPVLLDDVHHSNLCVSSEAIGDEGKTGNRLVSGAVISKVL